MTLASGFTNNALKVAVAVATASLLVATMTTSAGAREGRSVRIDLAVDGGPHAVVAIGSVRYHGRASARSAARQHAVLQQRTGTHGRRVWHVRARGIVEQGPGADRFRVRWQNPPLHRPLVVRVSVQSGGRTVARSAATTAQAGTVGAVFYAGDDGKNHAVGAEEAKGAVWRLTAAPGAGYDGNWAVPTPKGQPPRCDMSKAAAFPDVIKGRRITSLVGFSLGRLGPVYFLRTAGSRADQITSILLLDPGNAEDDMGDCDMRPDINPAHALRDWLAHDPVNKLTIIAGKRTSGDENGNGKVDGREPDHLAIQAFYIRSLSATTVANQVRICDSSLSHEDIMGKFGRMVGVEASPSCPSDTTRWIPKKPPPPVEPPPINPVTPTVHLDRGPAASAGYWYAITLAGFTADSDVSVSCRDSVDPAGFLTNTLHTDGAGNASTQSACYSGDGPDHWVVANGTVESNRVQWGGGGSPVPQQPPPPALWNEQQGSLGANTFTNPYNASGMGQKIPPYAWVAVSCKVYAPAIASANPDGYWYRIATAPWSNAYYAVANTFWNGDVPGQKPYIHNTDWAVPNC